MQFTATASQLLFSCEATQAENQQTNRILTAQYTLKLSHPPSFFLCSLLMQPTCAQSLDLLCHHDGVKMCVGILLMYRNFSD